MSKGDISLYADMVLIETALGNPAFTKTAQGSILSGLADMVKNYFTAHWDPSNREASIVNMLAPSAISMIFRGLGFGKLGLLFGVVASALHIDVDGMIHSIYNSIRGKIEQGKPVSPADIDTAVSSAVQEHAAAPSPEVAEQIGQQADQSPAWDKRNFDKELRDARLICLALEQYEKQMFQLTKEGQRRGGGWLSGLSGTRANTGSLIGRVIGFVFKFLLASAGFMVAGDLLNKFIGRPNALDHTYQAGQTPSGGSWFGGGGNKPQSQEPSTMWVEHVTNDPSSIENMLLGFAREVHPELAGKEDAIKKSPTFQAIRDHIAWYNHTAAGEPEVYIPSNYTDKKSLVDRFAGEVK